MTTGTGEADPGCSGITWGQLANEVPDLAESVRACFDAHRRHVVATLTIIGSPRVSGTVMGWWRDEIWIAAPEGSPRARDLRSDARFALHSNPGEGHGNDAKLGGVAVELVAGALQDDLLVEAGLTAPIDVFLLRLRSAQLTLGALSGAASDVLRWRAGGGPHRH